MIWLRNNSKTIWHIIISIYCIFLVLFAWTKSVHSTANMHGFQFKWPIIIGGCFIFLLSNAVIYLLMIKKEKLHKVYLMTSMGLFLLLICVQTPEHGMDIRFHIDSTYVLSDYLIGTDIDGWKLEQETLSVYPRRTVDEVILSKSEPYSITEVYAKAQEQIFTQTFVEDEQLINVNTYQGAVSKPLYFYLPQALGFTLARLLHLNQFWLYFIGRLFLVSTCVLLTYYAVKNTPFAKELFFLSGIIPTTMMLTASVSRDGLIMAVSFYFISKCLQMSYEEKSLNERNLIKAVIAIALLAPYKMVYIPLALLLLLVLYKKSQYGFDKKRMIISGIGIGLILIISFILFTTNFLPQYLFGKNTYSMGENAPFTLPYIFTHLGDSLKVYVMTIIKSSVRYIANMFTTEDLGGGQHKEMTLLYFLIFLGATFPLYKRDKEEEKVIKWRERMIMMFPCIGVYLLTLFAFLLCTPIDNELIIGVQGRYFTPILPLIFMIFYDFRPLSFVKWKWLEYLKKIDYKRYIILASYLLSLFVIVNMYVWSVT